MLLSRTPTDCDRWEKYPCFASYNALCMKSLTWFRFKQNNVKSPDEKWSLRIVKFITLSLIQPIKASHFNTRMRKLTRTGSSPMSFWVEKKAARIDPMRGSSSKRSTILLDNDCESFREEINRTRAMKLAPHSIESTTRDSSEELAGSGFNRGLGVWIRFGFQFP